MRINRGDFLRHTSSVQAYAGKSKALYEKTLNYIQNIFTSLLQIHSTNSLKGRVSVFSPISHTEQAAYAEGAHKVYENAHQSALPFMVIGSKELRNSPVTLENLGAISECSDDSNISRVGAGDRRLSGSVLQDESWSMLKNHGYMLGGIHAGKEFHLYGGDNNLNETLWDTENQRVRVTTREIAILRAAGYKQIATKEQIQDFGMIFVCDDPDKAANFSLSDTINAANSIKTLDDALALLN